MAARKSILVVSAAPGNAIADIAKEMANRGHFTLFACANPLKFVKVSSELLQTIEVDTRSPVSLSQAATHVSAHLENSDFSGLDVLINDVGIGSSLALLDVMMNESPERFEAKVSDALSLVGSFANLLAVRAGKVINMSSSGAMISALCMNKTSHFTAEKAILGISQQIRSEVGSRHIEVETVMLESLPSATQSVPKVLFPERSSYSSARSAVSRWTWGSCRPSQSLEPLFELVLENSGREHPAWPWNDINREDIVSSLEKGMATPAVC